MRTIDDRFKETNGGFNIGDSVKIINTGSHYPTFMDAAKALKAKKWKMYTSVKNNVNGKIVNKLYYIDGRVILYLVDVGTKEIIISGEGIEFNKGLWDTEENTCQISR